MWATIVPNFSKLLALQSFVKLDGECENQDKTQAPGRTHVVTGDDIEQSINEEMNRALTDQVRESSQETGELPPCRMGFFSVLLPPQTVAMDVPAPETAPGNNDKPAPACRVCPVQQTYTKSEHQKCIPAWLGATGSYDV